MPTVAIAGAGLMGRLIGWQLVKRGADVTLYERTPRHAPASAAHVAAAMLAPTSELPDSDDAVFAMGQQSLSAWPAMLDELGVPYGIDGSLLVAHGPDGPLLDKFYRSLGAHRETEAKWLNAAGVAELEPALAGRFERGLYLPHEGWLDNRALLAALEGRCGTIRFGKCVDPVRLAAHPSGDALVVDCRGVGADFAELRGVRGEAIRLHAPEVDLTRPVRLMHPRYQLYVAPRPGRHYVVGATQLESESTQATTVRSALELLSAAFALHPGFAEAEITELCAGLRPAYPDNLPRVEWRRGVLRVNGLYRHGFLIAPAVAQQAIEEIERCMYSSTATASA
ncbi:MAG: FAD-dependent oxidoreductase [Gammaproteobacteria bacterium]|nr:FAD-dependent oxidoreductase [Gammaproteobacteria bacterium]